MICYHTYIVEHLWTIYDLSWFTQRIRSIWISFQSIRGWKTSKTFFAILIWSTHFPNISIALYWAVKNPTRNDRKYLQKKFLLKPYGGNSWSLRGYEVFNALELPCWVSAWDLLKTIALLLSCALANDLMLQWVMCKLRPWCRVGFWKQRKEVENNWAWAFGRFVCLFWWQHVCMLDDPMIKWRKMIVC